MSKVFVYGMKNKFGAFTLTASEIGLKSIEFKESKKKQRNQIIDLALEELSLYFRGEPIDFSVPLEIDGTPFQLKCWKELIKIKYGTTISYKEEALKLGGVNYARAVAGANNKNKLPIIIPCHRVIGSNGSLVGYAGGLQLKQALLDLESKV